MATSTSGKRERDERIPSFHSYAAVPRKKRGRDMSSPTKDTPLQPSKKQESLENKRKAWTLEEKVFLETFLNQAGGVPNEGSNLFWENCAVKLNKHCGTNRTGEMCRSRYRKVKSLFEGGVASRSVCTQTESVCVSTETHVETQTLPALPIKNKKTSTSFWASLNPGNIFKNQEKSPIQDMLRSRLEVESISTDDRAELLTSVLHSDATTIADCIFKIPALKLAVQNRFLFDIEKSAASKCVRSKLSYLFPKDYHSLRDFSFKELFSELMEKQPFLLKCLLAVSVPTTKMEVCSSTEYLEGLIPKLSFIYSSLMAVRFHELSRLQKTLSIVLMDEHVHEKVFDRLQVLGVTTSYAGALSVMEDIGNHHMNEVVKGVQSNNTFRIIGDNCNIKVGVKHERSKQHGTMFNWFASAIIMQTKSFDDLPDTPQGDPQYLPMTAFLPTAEDERRIKNDYRFLISQVARDFLPNLKFLFENLPSHILGEYNQELSKQNLVVPLQVLPLNEQKYADVVQILDHYEDKVSEIYEAAGEPIAQIPIGGDQLTRERFSGAKSLRAGCLTDKGRYSHLYPITFELWHTAMNFLLLIFNTLYNEKSFDKGTMNAARIKLSRKTVKKEVQHHYDHDKDFFISFLRAYIVEALCNFFGLETLDGEPTKNIPNGVPAEEIEKWVQDTMDKFIDEYVWARDSDANTVTTQEHEEIVSTPLQLKLPNGSTVVIFVQQKQKKKVQKIEFDRVKHYGHTVLQLGLLYLEFLDIIKVPDRDRLMTTFKYMMQVFKAHNSRSKYALEMLRFLCHQQSSYSLQTAHKAVYGLFVNTAGKVDSHIPADLEMEHLIRRIKKLFKATGPNNLEGSVVKKSRALAGQAQIAAQYDKCSGVLVRANKHKKKSAHEDELKLIGEMKEAAPFTSQIGRSYDQFSTIMAPTHSTLNEEGYAAWINHHKTKMQFESGK